MAAGRKTGGRKPGTPNKRTEAKNAGVDRLLEEYGYDPLEAMIAVASDPETPIDVSMALAKEIAPYVYAKRKSVEVETKRDPIRNAEVDREAILLAADVLRNDLIDVPVSVLAPLQGEAESDEWCR